MSSFLLWDLLARKWMLRKQALDDLVRRCDDLPPITTEAAAGFRSSPGPSMKIDNGWAQIPISGILLRSVPWFYSYFGIAATAYGDIEANVRAALADPSVTGIALAINSCGGEVAGVYEAGETIFRARQQKPVRAFVEDQAASAAYWLASQAQSIVAGATARIGSIGTYMAMWDQSKAAEKMGLKVHLIKSGPHKGTGYPGSAISDAQIEPFQAIVDGLTEQFIEAVARGRGRDKQTVQGWADGREWLAGDAKRLGLIDGLASGVSDVARPGPMAMQADPAELYAAKLRKVMDEKKCSGTDAMKVCTREDPAGHEAFTERLNTDPEFRANWRKGTTESAAGTEQPAPADSGDFVAVARSMAKREGITYTMAAQRLAKERPELHQRYMEASAAR